MQRAPRLTAFQVQARVSGCPNRHPLDHTDAEHKITVVKVLTSLEGAEAEVSRLNHISADKNCRYFWCTSRLIEQSADVPKLV